MPAPSALAQSQDLRSPNAIDASQGSYLGRPHLQDLGSPDARDLTAPHAPTVTQAPIAEPTGLDWSSVAIGAPAGTGLVVLALALANVVRRRIIARNGLAHGASSHLS